MAVVEGSDELLEANLTELVGFAEMKERPDVLLRAAERLATSADRSESATSLADQAYVLASRLGIALQPSRGAKLLTAAIRHEFAEAPHRPHAVDRGDRDLDLLLVTLEVPANSTTLGRQKLEKGKTAMRDLDRIHHLRSQIDEHQRRVREALGRSRVARDTADRLGELTALDEACAFALVASRAAIDLLNARDDRPDSRA